MNTRTTSTKVEDNEAVFFLSSFATKNAINSFLYLFSFFSALTTPLDTGQ